ncbi:MAG: hypothetical protein KDN05_16610, partial [Verrucomicrobiae bacterium]|nr:hypothetical protein [Verrucomicrobiae bacterium]
ATALLCAVPLARQQATIGKLEARLADAILLEQLASRSRSADSRAAAGMSFLQRLARDLKSQNSDVPRYVSAIDHLDGLENGELVALARETAISSLSFEDRETILGCAFGPLARRDPQLALDALLEIPEPYRGKSFSVESLMQGVLRAYADENSAAALAWFTDHIELIRSIPGRENHGENSRENSLRQSLAYGFIEDDPEQAVRILRPVPKGLLLLFFQQYVQSREPSLRENAQGYIDVARGLLPEHEAGLAIGHLIHVHWVDWDESAPLAPTEKLLENFEFRGAETEAILRSSGEWRLQSASYESADQFKAEFLRFRTLLETYLRDRTDHLAGRILFSSISATNPEWVAGILADRKSIGLGDDAVAGFLAGMEENPTVLVNLDVLGRIRDSVTDSDAIQATFDRVLSRHSFMNR